VATFDQVIKFWLAIRIQEGIRVHIQGLLQYVSNQFVCRCHDRLLSSTCGPTAGGQLWQPIKVS